MPQVKQAKLIRLKILIRSVLILSAVAFFAACQSTSDSAPTSQTQSAVPDTPEADRERLLTRVSEYWQARIQRDTKTTFQYEHPVRQKQLGEELYQTSMKSNIKILEYTVSDFELAPQANDAEVPLQLKYEYTFPQADAGSMLVPTQVTDYWEKDQGVWYHVMDTKVVGGGKPRIFRQKTQDEQNTADSAKTD